MAIAVDDTTVARWSGAVVANIDVTSGSFTAPSGALLVVCVSCDSGNNEAQTHTVSDSGGLSWVEQKHADYNTPTAASNSGSSSIWTATTVSSVSRTIGAQHNTVGTATVSAKCYIVTGQHASPIGASGNNNTETANAPTLAMFTSTAANSEAFLAVCDWSQLGVPSSSDMTLDGADFSGLITATSGYKNCGTISVETASLDFPGTGATTLTWCALEIKAADAGGGADISPASRNFAFSSIAPTVATTANQSLLPSTKDLAFSATAPTLTLANVLLFGARVLDVGLAALYTECDKIFVCAAMPSSYTDATSGSNSIGNKNFGVGAAFGSPVDKSGGGRQVTSNPIVDGIVTYNGKVAAWAAVDSINSRLLASGALTGGKDVTTDQLFTLSSLTVGLPDQ